MSNRTANYTAFYVAEPFDVNNPGAYTTKDFVYYNMIKEWYDEDASFPFVDAHEKAYNLRDNSDWETTLKPRLHERLKASKNIIMILSSLTADSRALSEELTYGIRECKLPVIVVYPEYEEKGGIAYPSGNIKQSIKMLWDRLPAFRDNMYSVPTCHIPMNKDLLKKCLKDERFMVNTKGNPGPYCFLV